MKSRLESWKMSRFFARRRSTSVTLPRNLTSLVECYSVMISYFNSKNNLKHSLFFQERLKRLFMMPNVDDELFKQTDEFKADAKRLSIQPSHAEREIDRVTRWIRKSGLDSDIKDNLINRELKLQETTIRNRCVNQTSAAKDAFSVCEATHSRRIEEREF